MPRLVANRPEKVPVSSAASLPYHLVVRTVVSKYYLDRCVTTNLALNPQERLQLLQQCVRVKPVHIHVPVIVERKTELLEFEAVKKLGRKM